tara:strand:- start:259 stop:591 length:333 start_codon:yes stop_codon:yes gene_type:complete
MKDSDEDTVTEDLKAENISKDGVWTLSNGHSVDLRHVQLHLPSGYGHEQVTAVLCGTDGFIEKCPICSATLADTDSILIIMEEHYYLVGKCCNTMMLYELEKTEVMKQWI